MPARNFLNAPSCQPRWLSQGLSFTTHWSSKSLISVVDLVPNPSPSSLNQLVLISPDTPVGVNSPCGLIRLGDTLEFRILIEVGFSTTYGVIPAQNLPDGSGVSVQGIKHAVIGLINPLESFVTGTPCNWMTSSPACSLEGYPALRSLMARRPESCKM